MARSRHAITWTQTVDSPAVGFITWTPSRGPYLVRSWYKGSRRSRHVVLNGGVGVPTVISVTLAAAKRWVSNHTP